MEAAHFSDTLMHPTIRCHNIGHNIRHKKANLTTIKLPNPKHDIIIIIIYRLSAGYLQLYKGKGKVHPITGHEGPQEGAPVQRYSFLNLGAIWRWVVNATPPLLYPRERAPVPTVQEVGRAPGPAWTGAENLAPTGIRSPNRPIRSESLYRLRYPGPHLKLYTWNKPLFWRITYSAAVIL
jgi:hypothetical protein